MAAECQTEKFFRMNQRPAEVAKSVERMRDFVSTQAANQSKIALVTVNKCDLT